MIRRPPRSTRVRSSAASDVYKRQRHVCARLNSANNATTLCKNLVKIGPVISEEILIEIALPVDVVVRRISLNISGYTGLIFTIFSPHESALHADDGTAVSYTHLTLPTILRV